MLRKFRAHPVGVFTVGEKAVKAPRSFQSYKSFRLPHGRYKQARNNRVSSYTYRNHISSRWLPVFGCDFSRPARECSRRYAYLVQSGLCRVSLHCQDLGCKQLQHSPDFPHNSTKLPARLALQAAAASKVMPRFVRLTFSLICRSVHPPAQQSGPKCCLGSSLPLCL